MHASIRIPLSMFTLACALSSGTSEAQTTATGPYYAVPSWDQTMPASTRFVVLANFNGDAVLDRQTGLVWLRVPLAPLIYVDAVNQCLAAQAGGQFGWRLPTAAEASSLQQGGASAPDLPAGHPFAIPEPYRLWTVTAAPFNANERYVVRNDTNSGFTSTQTNDGRQFAMTPLCVRGPDGAPNP